MNWMNDPFITFVLAFILIILVRFLICGIEKTRYGLPIINLKIPMPKVVPPLSPGNENRGGIGQIPTHPKPNNPLPPRNHKNLEISCHMFNYQYHPTTVKFIQCPNCSAKRIENQPCDYCGGI